MPIYQTFSKRERERQGIASDDPLRYDLPDPLRTQIAYILNDVTGADFFQRRGGKHQASENFWIQVHDLVARERGLLHLGRGGSGSGACYSHLMEGDDETVLDLLDAVFRALPAFHEHATEQRMMSNGFISQTVDEAIEELNHRFREHGVGYELVENKLIRVDSGFLHTEVVVQSLTLLRQSRYTGASEEFTKALEHFRHGRSKDAIGDALKAFESTMKAIAAERGLTVAPGATSKHLIPLLLNDDFLPSYLDSHLNSLRSTMEGLPTVRNKTAGAGHGQGATPVEVPDHVAAYALHLAASNIVFLVEAHKASPQVKVSDA